MEANRIEPGGSSLLKLKNDMLILKTISEGFGFICRRFRPRIDPWKIEKSGKPIEASFTNPVLLISRNGPLNAFDRSSTFMLIPVTGFFKHTALARLFPLSRHRIGVVKNGFLAPKS